VIERNPHPVFSVLWAAWSLLTVALFVTPDQPTLTAWMIWAGVFLVVEVTGTAYTSKSQDRDTLSETMTWLQRHLSKHRKIARGWNAAMLAYIVVIAVVGVSLVSDVLLRYVIAMLIIVWLHDHWMSPDVHG